MGTAKRERQKANRQLKLEEMAREAQKDKRRRGAIKWVTLVVVGTVVVILIALLAGGKDDNDDLAADGGTTTVAATDTSAAASADSTVAPTATSGATLTADTPCPNADGSSERTIVFAKAPPMCIDAAKTYTALIETNKGNLTVALDAKNAPNTVNNFVVLARYHYFDGTNCHRIIQGFMTQCGDPSGTGNGDSGKYPGYEFADENLPTANSYPKGTLAMANAGANTNGSQFFTMLADYPLSPNYSVFGKVTDSDATLTALEAEADPSAQNGTPTKSPVTITKVTITEA